MKQEVQVLITLEWDQDIQLINSEDGVLKAIVNTYNDAVYKSDKTGEYYPKIIASSIKKEEPDIDLRPALKWFAELMEQRLRDNDKKGGWLDTEPHYLMDRLEIDAVGLSNAISYIGLGGAAPITKEAADIANYAMMIADLHAHKFGT